MLSPEEEARVLEAAAARGWISRTSLDPPDETSGATAASAGSPRWGARIDRLIAAGDLETGVVEQLLREVQPSAAAGKDPEPPLPLAGWERYELIRLIGAGGMGIVYEARDRRLQRAVALKFIRGEHQAGSRRFLQEARAQARIEHENVCKVYEVGEVEGRAYIAMELIQGMPLSQAAGQLRLEQRIRVLVDVAAATHAAHRIGVIHRDLKPSTVRIDEIQPCIDPQRGGMRAAGDGGGAASLMEASSGSSPCLAWRSGRLAQRESRGTPSRRGARSQPLRSHRPTRASSSKSGR